MCVLVFAGFFFLHHPAIDALRAYASVIYLSPYFREIFITYAFVVLLAFWNSLSSCNKAVWVSGCGRRRQCRCYNCRINIHVCIFVIRRHWSGKFDACMHTKFCRWIAKECVQKVLRVFSSRKKASLFSYMCTISTLVSEPSYSLREANSPFYAFNSCLAQQVQPELDIILIYGKYWRIIWKMLLFSLSINFFQVCNLIAIRMVLCGAAWTMFIEH